MAARARRHQLGQGLLVVLIFLAAFLLLIWASLRLAGDAFLGLSAVKADTRNTYALDAGVAYGLEYAHLTARTCRAVRPPPLALNYAPVITVTVLMTIPAGCTAANPVYNLTVTDSSSRRVLAQIYRSNVAPNPWLVRWEAYR